MIYGHGVDIVEVSRIKKALVETDGFKEKVFTEREIEYCEGRKSKYQSYAARFASKEALMKAIGSGWAKKVSWKDIEVINNESGKPFISLHGIANQIFKDKGFNEILLSISHTKEYAVGSVIIISSE